ncbi:MAG: metallophosphoesterase [Elusimicrobia bacterium]|nr:metallophosphoesterase [Elusimicrobiota bacterium]
MHALLVAAASIASAAALVRGPYVEGVTGASAFICWRTDVETAGALEVRLGPGARPAHQVLERRPQRQHCLEASDLSPSGRYEYRVGYGEPGAALVWTSTRAFGAAAAADAPALRFAVFGDTGQDTEGQRAVGRAIGAETPELVLHAGDVVYPHGEDADYDRKYFSVYGGFIDRIPLYFAVGNHDYANHRFRAEKGRRWIQDHFLRIHRLPRQREDGRWRLPPPGRTYYSFDWGPAHFAAIDANRVYPIPGAPAVHPESEQWRWLDRDLASSSARWKFVLLHQAVYSSGYHGAHEPLVEWVAPLLERHGVDLVFQGHDHHYERTAPIREGRPAERGPVYLVVGNGGAPLHSIRKRRAWSAYRAKRFGYVLVRIDGGRLQVEAKSPEGEVFDRLELRR